MPAKHGLSHFRLVQTTLPVLECTHVQTAKTKTYAYLHNSTTNFNEAKQFRDYLKFNSNRKWVIERHNFSTSLHIRCYTSCTRLVSPNCLPAIRLLQDVATRSLPRVRSRPYYHVIQFGREKCHLAHVIPSEVEGLSSTMQLRASRKARRAQSKLLQSYPHRCQLYKIPPVEDISLEEFERLAVDRLKCELDISNTDCPLSRGERLSFAEWM